MVTGAWPPHRFETVPWLQAQRGGTRADRTVAEITVAIPPTVAEADVSIDAALVADSEEALREVVALDTSHAANLGALGALLLRTESVATSKIEAIDASIDDYARALHGGRANPAASAMAAATRALEVMVGAVGRRRRLDLADLTYAHHELMRDDLDERRHAGQLRTVQNWIGGSDYSPRGALYIPPPPDVVPAAMDDLVAFANRENVPTLAQSALAHAQFESIHPFTDGNGRIGRALINSILRRRGATTSVVIPLASALVARRDRYFELLDTYRRGEVDSLISAFVEATRISAQEARITAVRLGEIPAQWADLVGGVRAGSAVARLLAELPTSPVLSSDDAVRITGGARSSGFTAVDRLADAGVLRPLTDRRRGQVWGAGLILDELADLDLRIAAASR